MEKLKIDINDQRIIIFGTILMLSVSVVGVIIAEVIKNLVFYSLMLVVVLIVALAVMLSGLYKQALILMEECARRDTMEALIMSIRSALNSGTYDNEEFQREISSFFISKKSDLPIDIFGFSCII